MHFMAALITVGLLALLFIAAAYLALSQSPNQPSTHRRYEVRRNPELWPDKPVLQKPSVSEKRRHCDQLDHELKKYRSEHPEIRFPDVETPPVSPRP